MNAAFYIATAVAVISTILVITQLNPVHALLYLIVSLMSVAMIFYLLGAPFAAALEVIVYAGAIMVLFVFVVMMLNRGPQTVVQERGWITTGMWWGPCLLAAVLLAELLYVMVAGGDAAVVGRAVDAKAVGTALFGPYLLGVELASLLLLAGLVGAYHLGRRPLESKPRKEEC
jgi:NADH-quinone oxidoreductase subunit J